MEKIGFAYQEEQHINQSFDGIVIGSGIGGLCAAALLAKEGKKMLVLEQHYEIGGFTHVFKRKGFEWDVGLHYIGGVGDQEYTLRKAFDYISDGSLKWASMDEVYDVAVFGKEKYEFPQGKYSFIRQLKRYFPETKDKESIDRYFEILEEIENLGSGYYIDKTLPKLLSKIAQPFLRKRFLKYSDKTTLETLREITDNEKLIGVLTAQYGDYGLPPSKSSFFMHAMVVNHYMKGGNYPIGGPANIAKTITSVIQGNGGMVLFNAKVDTVLVENNVAKGVKMVDGRIIKAPIVISDTGIKHTFLQLLESTIQKEHELVEKINLLEPATAHLGLYIGLNKDAKTLQLPKCNYWVFPNGYNHDRSQAAYNKNGDPIPVAFISFPSAKDPDWDNRYPNKSTIEIISLIPFEWFEKWSGTEWKKRGESYEELKEKLTQELLSFLWQLRPDLKKFIVYAELSTPLSTQKFSNNLDGAIYGLNHTPQRFRSSILRPQTPIKNLFLTGQDVTFAGIGGALMGGVLTVSAILKKNMINRF